MVGGLRDVITCAEFQIEIFIGYDFTGGRIFDFPIDFSTGLTTVQRYCAACDTKIENSTPCKIVTHEGFNLKLGTRDYVADITHCATLGSNRQSGVSPQIGEI